MKILTNLNLAHNELRNATFQKLATDPTTPKLGQFWFNSTDNVLRYYDGSQTHTIRMTPSISGTGAVEVTDNGDGSVTVNVDKAAIDALNVDADTLDGKHASAFATSGHGHTLADVSDAGSAASLDAPATGVDALAGEVVKGDDSRLTDARAPTAHTHAISEVTNLQTTLDGKSDDGHGHTLADVSDAGSAASLDAPATGNATDTQVVKGNDSRLSDARTPTAHSHAISEVTNLQSALNAKLDDTQKGAANGLAELDANSKVPIAQLPDVTFGGLSYQGTWDAAANTPTLNGTTPPDAGVYYKVATAGSTDLSGITDWKVGDWAISDGTNWQKIDNSETVSSVAGKTGAVTLGISDIGSLQTALDGKADDAHTHPWSDVTGKPAQATRWPAWSEVSSKPSTFTPESHTHAISDVTSLQSALDDKLDLTGGTLTGPLVIRDMYNDDQGFNFVTDFDTNNPEIVPITFDGMGSAARSAYALEFLGDTNQWSVEGNPIVLDDDSRLTDARTPTAHTHAISEVTDLQTELDDKLDATDGTATGLTIADGSHLHFKDSMGPRITAYTDGTGSAVDSLLLTVGFNDTVKSLKVADDGAFEWNDKAVVLDDDSRLSDARTPTAHSHAISEVTDLQTELDKKTETYIYVMATAGPGPVTVTHNIGTTSVLVQVFDADTNEQVMTDVSTISANEVEVNWVGSYRLFIKVLGS